MRLVFLAQVTQRCGLNNCRPIRRARVVINKFSSRGLERLARADQVNASSVTSQLQASRCYLCSSQQVGRARAASLVSVAIEMSSIELSQRFASTAAAAAAAKYSFACAAAAEKAPELNRRFFANDTHLLWPSSSIHPFEPRDWGRLAVIRLLR